MAGINEDDRKLEPALKPPGDADVRRGISRNTWSGQRAHAADSDIELGAVRQVERRTQEPLVGRVVARGAHVGIRAVRLRAQALFQEERSRAQAPVSRRLEAAPG